MSWSVHTPWTFPYLVTSQSQTSMFFFNGNLLDRPTQITLNLITESCVGSRKQVKYAGNDHQEPRLETPDLNSFVVL